MLLFGQRLSGLINRAFYAMLSLGMAVICGLILERVWCTDQMYGAETG
jgi:hypothetical protein